MKSYLWKLLICLVPCGLAAWVTINATIKYQRGDSGGFKLGVDLVGGTILVYEIDLRKSRESNKDFDAAQAVANLADKLKKRIDPNDLYNITIRPAGGEGRIEIILPTGGTHRAKKAEENWNDLLKSLENEYLGGKKLEVGRGKILELADQIQLVQSQSLWKEKLFSTQGGWDRLRKRALNYWAQIENEIEDIDNLIKEKKIAGPNKVKAALEEIGKKPGDTQTFENFVMETLAKDPETATTRKTIQTWFKKQAWEETMTQVRKKWLLKPWTAEADYTDGMVVTVGDKTYRAKASNKNQQPPSASWKIIELPDLEPYQEDMERIAPDSTHQLTTFVLTKGVVIGQGALSLLEPVVEVERVFTDEGDPTAKDVREFIRSHYGPPVQEITDKINAHMEKSGLGKDLSVEEVQRIKDLISKVGSLEFRILANNADDVVAVGLKEGDGEARVALNTPSAAFAKLILSAQQNGIPPPAPRESEASDAKPKRYKIVTANKNVSAVTYSWVELGPQERKALNLDNAAAIDSSRNSAWHAAAAGRNKAIQLPEGAGTTEKFLLQGALFYSRVCKDRNLAEEERRKKEVEYFVLTRDPEFKDENSEIRTDKIDGGYLRNAYGAPGADLRPTVHFEFNNAGGDLFGNITRKNVSEDAASAGGNPKRRHLAIILDGMVMSAPTINSEIRNQGQISGNFTQKEVDSLVNVLRSGQLPASLKQQPVSESTIAATLGEETIAAGVKAILLSFAAVLIFMCVYYRFAGLVASVALMANLLLTVGFMVGVQATFTLSGLAGIVLTLGMAVDANVLIYERLREERERGASLLQAIRNGYERALPTIIDTHLSSIFTAIVLYIVGNDNLKGFAISMTVGLVISLFTSLYMTRMMFDYWQYKGWLTKLSMMRLFARPDWDFMSVRHIMFTFTLVIAVLGAALFIGRLPNDLNIDFVGGTAYGGQLNKALTIADLRPLVEEKHQEKVLGGVIVKEVEGSAGRRFDVTFPNGDNKLRTLSFSNTPEGATPAEREATVKKRASMLPEPSIELLFNSTNDAEITAEIKAGKSRNFVMRTTEKEAELVQACADQLFRDSNGQLLKKVFARYDKDKDRDTRFRFFETQKEADAFVPETKTVGDAVEKKETTATVSPSFVKSLLNREFRRAFGVTDEKKPLPFLFDVIGEGSSDGDGKHRTIKVTFDQAEKVANFDALTDKAFASAKEALAHPLPDRLENFDSALANETRFRAMWAILASWAAILVYLWFRFGNWTFGLAAVLCLIHDLFFTLGAIAACHYFHGGPLGFIGEALRLEDFKLDLPSVAALLTLVGYSVNDTIVVFDRIREVRGKNPELTPKMINDSINQTLSRTILASLTVWLVVFVLYLFGGPGVHLFAFVMVVGVIIGTYSSIYVAAPLLLMFGEGKHEETTQTGAKLAGPAPVPEGAFKPAT